MGLCHCSTSYERRFQQPKYHSFHCTYFHSIPLEADTAVPKPFLLLKVSIILSKTWASPKSHSLTMPSLRSMFLGLRSLCAIWRSSSWRYRNASKLTCPGHPSNKGHALVSLLQKLDFNSEFMFGN